MPVAFLVSCVAQRDGWSGIHTIDPMWTQPLHHIAFKDQPVESALKWVQTETRKGGFPISISYLGPKDRAISDFKADEVPLDQVLQFLGAISGCHVLYRQRSVLVAIVGIWDGSGIIWISGRCIDATTEQPIRQFTIINDLYPVMFAKRQTQTNQVTTSEHGTFRIPIQVAAGGSIYPVKVTVPDIQPIEQTIKSTVYALGHAKASQDTEIKWNQLEYSLDLRLKSEQPNESYEAPTSR